MKTFPKRTAIALVGALAVTVLTPGIAFAPWRRVSDTAYFDFKICKDGARLAISDTEYEGADELAAIPRGEVHTKNPIYTNPPVIDRPPEPEPLPVPPPEAIIFQQPAELRFAPVGNPDVPDDPDPNAYSVHQEILWTRTLAAGDLVGFDLVPGNRDVVPRAEVVANCLLDRSLDIRPFSPLNRVNPNSQVALRVLVKSSSFIDATKILNGTVRFGPAGARPLRSSNVDLDKDGDRDRLFLFTTRDAGIPCGATSAVLKASTSTPGPLRLTGGPTHYELYDSVRTVRC
jgi:hypothetical protein